MTGPDVLFDPGLQPERTLLAWGRTCLALGAAATVAVRLAADVLGPASAVLGAVGIATALGAFLVAVRRYRRSRAELVETGRLPVDGAALGLLTVTLLLTAPACVVFVLGASLR